MSNGGDIGMITCTVGEWSCRIEGDIKMITSTVW